MSEKNPSIYVLRRFLLDDLKVENGKISEHFRKFDETMRYFQQFSMYFHQHFEKIREIFGKFTFSLNFLYISFTNVKENQAKPRKFMDFGLNTNLKTRKFKIFKLCFFNLKDEYKVLCFFESKSCCTPRILDSLFFFRA